MQAPIELQVLELQVDELNRQKKERVETVLIKIGQPKTEVATILAFADSEMEETLDTICSNILEEQEEELLVVSPNLQGIIQVVENNHELAESVLIYRTGGIPPLENHEQINLFNLLNAYNLDCVTLLAKRIEFFALSRKSDADLRVKGTQSLYNVISAEKFDLADYLLSLDPGYEKTMDELVNQHSLVKKIFETLNLPVFKWQLTKKPDLRLGIEQNKSYIQRFEDSKNQLSKFYSGYRLHKKLEDANEFRNLIFAGLGYDLQAVNYDQLKCLDCSPKMKEEINALAKLTNYNIISVFECVKGRSQFLHNLIIEKNLITLLVYFEQPRPTPIVQNQNLLFAQKTAEDNFVKAFVEQIPFFNKTEQLNFKNEINQMIQRDKLNQQTSVGCKNIVETLKNRSEISRFNKNLGETQFNEELNGWKNVIENHLKHIEIQTLQYLFFNAIIKNNIETVKVMAIAMKKAGWPLDKTDEKLVQCLQILKNSDGETASLKMLCALRPAFNTEESELAESPRIGQ